MIEDARSFQQMRNRNLTLERATDAPYEMLGSSAAMRELFQRVARVAASDATVFGIYIQPYQRTAAPHSYGFHAVATQLYSSRAIIKSCRPSG